VNAKIGQTSMNTTTGGASTVGTSIEFEIPPGACDCHVHVFDPARFPYDSRRIYTPPEASIDALRKLQTALHMDRLVVVAPSVYGTDNSCTIDALRRFGASARGVVVIDDRTTPAALDDMAAVGVRGVRLNLETTEDTDAVVARRTLHTIGEQLHDRDWHIQFDTRLSVISALRDDIAVLPFPVVISHFGRARAALGPRQPGFDDLLELVKLGRVYVKISAPYRVSNRVPDYSDTTPLAQALVGANPERVLWGSNWPHPGRAPTSTAIAPPYPNNDGRALNLLAKWVPDATVRKKILVDNPVKLYGF
jgi:predicted TIM-barrel fold metal-dependent hydrolase